MKVLPLHNIVNKNKLFDTDSNGRTIYIYQLNNVSPIGESLFYPNVLLNETNSSSIFNPINETTMSLKSIEKEYGDMKPSIITKVENDNMFFFVYNTDNYFHFVYDTLPYLITYKELLKSDPNIKLLMNYPNSGKKEHYKFVMEFLAILDIDLSNIKIIDKNTEYNSVLISTSYTHDFNSNLPPRQEIYSFYKEIVNKFKYSVYSVNTPKKIYISRRSWLHGDYSNIGTNYTTRRKMINEDALVDLLSKEGYIEVFTENMSTVEKIVMFSNAESVIGAIGGGLCNILFSKETCKLIAIISPTFLEVNERFKFSFNNVNTLLFDNVNFVEETEFKTYMRVKVDNIIGEIIEISYDELKISYSDQTIAGWNNELKYMTKTVKKDNCIKLDNGLNSPWELNLEAFKNECL